jgi:ParB family transcriptional regulator, chromosome partitioning protein
MNKQLSHRHIEWVPIAQINVLNPRARNGRIHQQIIDSIQKAGLKRPIVISRRRSTQDGFRFDLVCGQGRIEALQRLSCTEIPAFVVDADPKQCLMLSVVENVARRHHRPIDQMREIGELRVRGHTDKHIAEMIGVSPSWVNMICHLLDNGEERLLDAVERELIGLDTAINVSRGSSAEIQNFLLDEYNKGLKGKKLARVRQLVEQRLARRKHASSELLGKRRVRAPRASADELRRLYKEETEHEQQLAAKARVADRSVTCAVVALRELLADDGFRKLFLSEELHLMMPHVLKTRVDFGALR